jgi:hypothetical protein
VVKGSNSIDIEELELCNLSTASAPRSKVVGQKMSKNHKTQVHQKKKEKNKWEDEEYHKLRFLSTGLFPRWFIDFVMGINRAKELCYSKIQKHLEGL